MNRLWLGCLALSLFALPVQAQDGFKISWKKTVLDRKFRAEGVAVFDVNKDGRKDVVTGDCWYEAPKEPTGEWKRHIIRKDREFEPVGSYSQCFAVFADDYTGDGYDDIIVIPFPGAPCFWYENPGKGTGPWKEHLLTTSACNETPIFIDLFKTGKKTLVMGWNPPKSNDMGEMCTFVPGKDARQPWEKISISGPSAKGKMIPGTQMFSHGLGHGDVNADGRVDVLCTGGWWEQPEKVDPATPWKFHPFTRGLPLCADIHAFDVDGDGKADLISSSAHDCGFWWHQLKHEKDATTPITRDLFPNAFTQGKSVGSVPLSKEEQAIYAAVNGLRYNHQGKRAPLAANAELSRMAREHAEKMAKTGAKEANIGGNYKGKVLFVGAKKDAKNATANPPAEKGKKGALVEFVESILPDGEKESVLQQPHFEVGVGYAKSESGEVQVSIVIGDRGLFSLPSQTHALRFVDINGDGQKDLVTGRRWYAHSRNGDNGSGDPAYLYWFEAKKSKDGVTSFTPHVIDDDSGVGTQFEVADIDGDGIPDIIISNKRGVFILQQVRTPIAAAPPGRRE